MSLEHTNDKAGRFERLAERRVTETIKKMRLIGNLANRHNYSYSEERAKQIIDALNAEPWIWICTPDPEMAEGGSERGKQLAGD